MRFQSGLFPSNSQQMSSRREGGLGLERYVYVGESVKIREEQAWILLFSLVEFRTSPCSKAPISKPMVMVMVMVMVWW